MISQVDLEEEAGDDAKDGVVDDEHDDEGVGHRGDRSAGEGAGQVASQPKQQHVAGDRVEVHEDVLDHDVDVGALSFDQVLVVDSSKDRTKNLDLIKS